MTAATTPALVERSVDIGGVRVVASAEAHWADRLDDVLASFAERGSVVEGDRVQRGWGWFDLASEGEGLRVVAPAYHRMPRRRHVSDLSFALLIEAAQDELVAAAGVATPAYPDFSDGCYVHPDKNEVDAVRAFREDGMDADTGWRIVPEPTTDERGPIDYWMLYEELYRRAGFIAVLGLPTGWSVTIDREGPVAVFDPEGAERVARPFPESVRRLCAMTRDEMAPHEPA